MMLHFEWRNESNSLWAFAIFVTFWTLMTLLFDRLLGYDAYRQIRAESYPSVPGVIRYSAVKKETGSFGDTYDVDVKYEYSVGTRNYTGDIYRRGEYITSNAAPARKFVKQHPDGATVAVYYDPENPADAILSPGLNDMNFMFALILTLLNGVMIGSWVAVIQTLRLRARPAGGVPILQRPYGFHLRLPRFSWQVQAAGLSFAMLFVSLWVVILGMRGELSATGLFVVWGILIATNVVFFYWKRFRVGSGVSDLVVDFERKVFSLPQSYGREGSQENPLSGFRNVEVVTETHETNHSRSTLYTPTMIFTDARYKRRREPLVSWTDRNRAESLAEWLNERMKSTNDKSCVDSA